MNSVFAKTARVSIFFVLTVFSLCQANENDFNQSQELQYAYPYKRAYKYEDITVTKVIDAETIELTGGRRLKLIGVAPLSTGSTARSSPDLKTIQYYQFLKKLIEAKEIDIEVDAQEYDQYQRLLGYVYLRDGTFVNAELLRQGYGQPDAPTSNTRYQNLFFRLYRESKENERGLWK